MSGITEVVTILATSMAEAFKYIYDKGGDPILIALATLGVFAILSTTIQQSGRALGALFVVCIAAPWLFIEHLYKKYKEKKKVKK